MHGLSATSRLKAAAALAALALAGCGEEDEGAPAACTNGQDAVLAALRAAPAPVRLEGSTPLSTCLKEGADGEEQQIVGIAFVESASALATRARREPEGRAALQLGYLVAAAHRGGDATQGVNAELLRRLDQELTTVDEGSRAVARGRQAGEASG